MRLKLFVGFQFTCRQQLQLTKFGLKIHTHTHTHMHSVCIIELLALELWTRITICGSWSQQSQTQLRLCRHFSYQRFFFLGLLLLFFLFFASMPCKLPSLAGSRSSPNKASAFTLQHFGFDFGIGFGYSNSWLCQLLVTCSWAATFCSCLISVLFAWVNCVCSIANLGFAIASVRIEKCFAFRKVV